MTWKKTINRLFLQASYVYLNIKKDVTGTLKFVKSLPAVTFQFFLDICTVSEKIHLNAADCQIFRNGWLYAPERNVDGTGVYQKNAIALTGSRAWGEPPLVNYSATSAPLRTAR